MRRYETVFISVTDLPPEELQEIVERCAQVITARKGIMIRRESWGKRKLAYPIEKQKFGVYSLLEFASEHGALGELDRVFRFDDRILRYQTVKIADEVDQAALEKELEEARKKVEVEESPVPAEEAETETSEPKPEEKAEPESEAGESPEKETEG